MGAAQFGDGIVPIAVEDAAVKTLRSFHGRFRFLRRRFARTKGLPGKSSNAGEFRFGRLDKIGQQQFPQPLGGSGIAGKQGALDHFGQIGEGKHRSFGVGDVARQQ